MLLLLKRGFYDFKNLLGTGHWRAGRFSCKCSDPQHRKCLSPHLQPLCQCSPWRADRVVLGLRLRPSKSLNKFRSLSVDPEKATANTTSFSRYLFSFFKKGLTNFHRWALPSSLKDTQETDLSSSFGQGHKGGDGLSG